MDLPSLAKGIVVQGVSQMWWQKDLVVSRHHTGLSPALGQASCGFFCPPPGTQDPSFSSLKMTNDP